LLSEWVAPKAFGKVVEARTEQPRERVAGMLGPLAKAKLLAAEELTSLFTDTLEFLEDEVVDVPFIAVYYSRFIAAAVAQAGVPLAFVAKAFAPLVDACLVKDDLAVGGHKGAAYMFVEVVRSMVALDGVGEEGAKKLYDAAKTAGLDVTQLLPSDAQTPTGAVTLLATASLGFLDPSLVDSVKKAEEAANAEAVEAQVQALEVYLTSGVLGDGERGQDTEAIVKWIDEHITSPPNDARVARVVMRCVLESALDKEEPPAAPKICKQIERRALLLKKCTAADGAAAAPAVRLLKQAGCLYEVQAFCGSRGWPHGLIKKLFYNLYETDVVFEDAYGVWREDVNDATPGKDKALFQVNEFLQWLDEAAEDEDDGDD